MSIATRREVARKQRRRLRLRLLARRSGVEKGSSAGVTLATPTGTSARMAGRLPEQRRPVVLPPSRARS